MNDKWKYFDRVYASRRWQKERDVLTLCIHIAKGCTVVALLL
jgi:hypothetical protein